MKRGIVAVFIVVAWALPAYAEVMDKEPSVPMIWGAAIFCSVLGFIAARFKPALAVGTGMLAALYLGGVVAEINDQTIRKAIIEEAGNSYQIHVYIAVAVVILAHATVRCNTLDRQGRDGVEVRSRNIAEPATRSRGLISVRRRRVQQALLRLTELSRPAQVLTPKIGQR